MEIIGMVVAFALFFPLTVRLAISPSPRK